MANTVQIVVNLRDNASGALGKITSGLSGMASVAGGIVAANVIGRIGEGFAGVASTGFNFNRSIENATAKLNAFTKDANVSQGILRQLREEANKTPFAFEDMASAGTALLPVANMLNMDLMDLVGTAEILKKRRRVTSLPSLSASTFPGSTSTNLKKKAYPTSRLCAALWRRWG
jgi:hypothetical protein